MKRFVTSVPELLYEFVPSDSGLQYNSDRNKPFRENATRTLEL